MILIVLEGDIGVSPNSVPLLLVGANLDLTWGIIKGEWVIEGLCKGGGGCEVIGAISKFWSLLSIPNPFPSLICLSMSVIGTMLRCMSLLSESELITHPDSHSPRPNLMTTFVSISEPHSVFTICSIGGEMSTRTFG